MGCDFYGFIEIEADNEGEYDSLYGVQADMPRHYELFGALAGVRGEKEPLFAPRGVPGGLGVHGFGVFYRPIVKHSDSLEWRGEKFVLLWEVGGREVLRESRWALHDLGYVVDDGLEVPGWLRLSEVYEALAHASIDPATLPVEYRCVFKTMEVAESVYGRGTRLVFWFSDV